MPAGYVGVKVYLLGGPKGVDTETLGVGKYWIGVNEDLFLFPTFKQNYTWTETLDDDKQNEAIVFQTKEGMQVSADVGITYTIDPAKVTQVFQAYRRGVDEITDTYLRNNVRDAFNAIGSTMSVESVYGEGKAKLMADVTEQVSLKVRDVGINIEDIYLVNSIRLPDNVVKALNVKVEATQRAQQREDELRESIANGAKAVAAAEGEAKALLLTARAQAEANEILGHSLTQELIDLKKVEKWDGSLPFVTGGSNMIDLKNITK